MPLRSRPGRASRRRTDRPGPVPKTPAPPDDDAAIPSPTKQPAHRSQSVSQSESNTTLLRARHLHPATKTAHLQLIVFQITSTCRILRQRALQRKLELLIAFRHIFLFYLKISIFNQFPGKDKSY